MKISVLSTHHPSTVELSWVAGSLWLELWDQELNEKMFLSRYHPSIVVRSFVRGSCSHFTLATTASNVFRGSRRFRHYRQTVPTILHSRKHLKVALLTDQEANFTIYRMLHYKDWSFLGPSRIVALVSWVLISHEAGPSARLVDNRDLKLRVVCSFLDLSQRMQPG
jgi:hypothetical protein